MEPVRYALEGPTDSRLTPATPGSLIPVPASCARPAAAGEARARVRSSSEGRPEANWPAIWSYAPNSTDPRRDPCHAQEHLAEISYRPGSHDIFDSSAINWTVLSAAYDCQQDLGFGYCLHETTGGLCLQWGPNGNITAAGGDTALLILTCNTTPTATDDRLWIQQTPP